MDAQERTYCLGRNVPPGRNARMGRNAHDAVSEMPGGVMFVTKLSLDSKFWESIFLGLPKGRNVQEGAQCPGRNVRQDAMSKGSGT